VPVIRSKPSTLQEIEQSAPQLVAKLNHAADRLNDVLNDSNRKAFADTLHHLSSLTAVLDKRAPDIDHALLNISSASDKLNTDLGDLHQVLGHADLAVGKIDHVATDLDTQINSAQLAQFVTQSRALVQSLTVLSNKIGKEPTSIIFGDRRKGYTPP